MNIFRNNKQSFFCFDDTAAGTGSASPAPASTPAPSSTPAAPASPTASPGSDTPAPASTSSDPFSGLDGDFDSDLDSVVLADAPPTDGGAQPTPATPAVVPAAPTAASPGQDPATPPAAPAATPPAQQDPAVTSPASPRAQLDEAIDGFKKNSVELAAWAGENMFKLSDADAAALVTNAETVIPRLMGQVFTQALAAAGNLMRNFVPAMIEQSVEQQHSVRTRATEAVSEFYTKNSDLNEKDHGALVSQWAKAYRSANPKATRAEAIDYVARAVRIQAGLPMPGQTPTSVAARQTPFTPARPGGRMPAPSAEPDPYAGLGMEFDTE